MTPTLDAARDALAVYRLTRLITTDTLFSEARDELHRRLAARGYVGAKVSEGLDCDWCVSIWVAAGALTARAVWPRGWRALSWVLATSAAAGLVAHAEHE